MACHARAVEQTLLQKSIEIGGRPRFIGELALDSAGEKAAWYLRLRIAGESEGDTINATPRTRNEPPGRKVPLCLATLLSGKKALMLETGRCQRRDAWRLNEAPKWFQPAVNRSR